MKKRIRVNSYKRNGKRVGSYRRMQYYRDGTGPHGRGLGPGEGKGCSQAMIDHLKKYGEARNVPDSYFNKRELNKGIKVEYEHTPVKAAAKEIVKDHLMESPDYYKELAKMEKKLKKRVRKSMPFRVFDRREQKFVSGPYESRQRASRRRDKLDDEYGGYNYAVVKV